MSEANEKNLNQEPEQELSEVDQETVKELLAEMEAVEEPEETVEPVIEETVDEKAAREAARRKAEKRTNRLYAAIGVVFLLVAITAVIWRSNLIQKNATAITLGGEKFTAGEVNFYFENIYRSFITNYADYMNYINLDPNASLRDQVIDENTAQMVGGEAGKTWHDTFMEQAIMQMSVVKAVVEKAEAEGYVYPEGMMPQYEETMNTLRETAASNGVSVDAYLQSMLDPTITEEIYADHMLRMIKYSAYAETFSNSLTYTDEQLEEIYQADPMSYDVVTYEYVIIDGSAESTTDADGKVTAPTEDVRNAALEAAKQSAEEMLAALRAGEDLETLAAANEKAHYSYSDTAIYYGDNVTTWLFEDGRKAGDTAHLDNNGTNQYVVHFIDRQRDESPTIDVRHILFMIEPTLTEEDAGYDEEVAQLMAEARAEAESVYAQWQAGEATEESFANLAIEHSDDGSRYSGGLYMEVTEGYMVQEFNDWCFDSSRKAGDTDVIETEFGAHVMYFVGRNQDVWELSAASALRNQDSKIWLDKMANTYTAKQHSLGMMFVD